MTGRPGAAAIMNPPFLEMTSHLRRRHPALYAPVVQLVQTLDDHGLTNPVVLDDVARLVGAILHQCCRADSDEPEASGL